MKKLNHLKLYEEYQEVGPNDPYGEEDWEDPNMPYWAEQYRTAMERGYKMLMYNPITKDSKITGMQITNPKFLPLFGEYTPIATVHGRNATCFPIGGHVYDQFDDNLEPNWINVYRTKNEDDCKVLMHNFNTGQSKITKMKADNPKFLAQFGDFTPICTIDGWNVTLNAMPMHLHPVMLAMFGH